MPRHLLLPGQFGILVEAIVDATTGRRPVVLLDGGSGAGKTQLAARLVPVLSHETGVPWQLVSLDDCYPGWHGLAAGSAAVSETILRPDAPGYRRWDWSRDVPADWASLDAAAPILVEGCGAITPTSMALAGIGLWYSRPARQREQLALDRDGDGYRPWWRNWARQEHLHWHQHRPATLADIVLHGHSAPAATVDA